MIAWFEADPDAASEWMRAHPEQADGVEAWARADPEGAIRDALAAPEVAGRKSPFCRDRKARRKEPAAQVARLQEMAPGGLREQVFAEVLKKWADSDPRAALAAVDGMTPGGPRDDTRKQVILAWAGKDPAAALAQVPALLPTLKTQLIGNPFLMSLAERVMEKDPRIGLDWINRLPPEHRQSVAIAGLAIWAQKEPAAALEWGLANGIEVARGRRNSVDSWRTGVLALRWPRRPPRPSPPSRRCHPARSAPDCSNARCAASAGCPTGKRTRPSRPTSSAGCCRSFPSKRRALSPGKSAPGRAFQPTFADVGAWARVFPAGEVRNAAVRQAVCYTYSHRRKARRPLLATLAPSPSAMPRSPPRPWR